VKCSFAICQNLTETGFGCDCLVLCIRFANLKSEPCFAKPLKPDRQSVSLTKLKTVQLFALFVSQSYQIYQNATETVAHGPTVATQGLKFLLKKLIEAPNLPASGDQVCS